MVLAPIARPRSAAHIVEIAAVFASDASLVIVGWPSADPDGGHRRPLLQAARDLDEPPDEASGRDRREIA